MTTASVYNDYGFPTQVTETATGDGNNYVKVTDNVYGADDVAQLDTRTRHQRHGDPFGPWNAGHRPDVSLHL